MWAHLERFRVLVYWSRHRNGAVLARRRKFIRKRFFQRRQQAGAGEKWGKLRDHTQTKDRGRVTRLGEDFRVICIVRSCSVTRGSMDNNKRHMSR